MRQLYFPLLLCLAACSSNVPANPRIISRSEYVEINHKMKPHVAQARKSLPFVKQRYMQGLKAGETLYLTIRLQDPDGGFELVRVKVQDWYDDQILGTVANPLFVIQSYHQGDSINFKESAVLDWTVVHADGRQEGDYVGKFLRGCGAGDK